MPVVGFDLRLQRELDDGKSWGDAGPYEELKGTVRFAIDPLHNANARITDVKLAPRTDEGLVEFSSDISIILPVDRSRGNRRMLLDVVNRGNRTALPTFNRAVWPMIEPDTPEDFVPDLGDGFLMKRGYTLVSCGWQIDAPDRPALITMQGPDAVGAAGEPIKGKVYSQLQSQTDTVNFLLSDRGHKAYPAYDMDEANAIMVVRDMPDGEARPVSRDFWRFGRIADDGEYVADPDYVCSEAGFEKGRLYQIVYTTVGARIIGLSFAALRDCVSWLKYGSDDFGSPIETKYAYAYGISQTGRFLRTYIYNDFNLDERGRESLDGIIDNVAGGMRGEFNQRWGQNSKDRNNMLTQMFPFASIPQIDIETEETDSLHRRLDDRESGLKVMYTNTSAEYHRGDASLLHTDPDGRSDIDIAPNARAYHFSGTEHGFGIWPPTDSITTGDGLSRAQNTRSVIDYKPLLRACLVHMDSWVSDGIEPPPSKHPALADGTAVPPSSLKAVFQRIPGANYPERHPLPHRRDYGLRDDREQVTTLPPIVRKVFGSLVSAVDEDGNEVAGIKLPEVAVPLATHTGWTLRHPDIGGETQPLMFAGATIPFAVDDQKRAANGDPRPSIAARYASKDDYLGRVLEAAERLVEQRYLLEEDIDVCVDQASKFWDYFAQ